MSSITAQDVFCILDRYDSASLLTSLLHLTEPNPTALAKLTLRYIHFCSVYGPSQAVLGGKLGLQHTLFRDPGRSAAQSANDACNDIAANIFFGAIDEFWDRMHPTHITHRAAAQAIYHGMMECFKVDPKDADEWVLGHPRLVSVHLERAKQGYGVYEHANLVQCIGFHIGTEAIADREFNILANFYMDKKPDFVKYLSERVVQIGKHTTDSWMWLDRHKEADSDHFDEAILCLDDIFKYTPPAQHEQVKNDLLLGIEESARVCLECYTDLVDISAFTHIHENAMVATKDLPRFTPVWMERLHANGTLQFKDQKIKLDTANKDANGQVFVLGPESKLLCVTSKVVKQGEEIKPSFY